tara:strand:- start:286 stop:576 length:291 start_codon:yes stop_codon:yes gene_type:complete
MDKDNKGIWNGGKTNTSHNEILRGLEDRYDIEDSEIEFREDLKKRQEIMNKTRIEKKPLHELYNEIDYEEKTSISGMGGVGGPVDSIRSANGSKKC